MVQTIFFIVIGIGAITGINLALLLVYAFKFGKWQGILEQKIKGIEESIKNHIPSQFSEMFEQLKNFTTRIDNMEKAITKRLTIIETKIKIETKE